jgi:4-amino-4-deoxy-L-arabinose transferase-like glycosyltransferase
MIIVTSRDEHMSCDRERVLKWTLAACCAVMFLSLGPRALWDPDEGRYAEIAREILVLHDWVTPHLNYLLYFEKPMMFMWLEAISFKV